MSEDVQRTLPLEDLPLVNLFGEQDRHLRAIEKRFGVTLVVRDGQLAIRGGEACVADAMRLLEHLITRVRAGETIVGPSLGERNFRSRRGMTTVCLIADGALPIAHPPLIADSSVIVSPSRSSA